MKKTSKKQAKKSKITKDSTLEEVLNVKGAEQVLSKFEVPCLSCPMAKYEIGVLKLEDVCKAYGLDLKKILKELDKLE